MTVEDMPTMVYTDDGRIDLTQLNTCKPLVIECNPECRCDALNCRNRVVGNRSRIQLMIVRTPTKSGWGVRAVDFIPKGTFVCEYLGSVIQDPVVAEIMGREYDTNLESYLFDLDAYAPKDLEMLTVDPSREGNISRYINHSCDPNLVQISIGTVNSTLFHRIGFFAGRNIYPNEELGFHYCYRFEQENRARFIRCNCGCRQCRTRLR
jgi:euchromatic histone-lysine N-methyltransferase